MQLRKKNDVTIVPQQIQQAPRRRQRFAVSEQFEKDLLNSLFPNNLKNISWSTKE